jgi:hypothetical protein
MSIMMWVAVCIFLIGFVIMAVLAILGTNDVSIITMNNTGKKRKQ